MSLEISLLPDGRLAQPFLYSNEKEFQFLTSALLFANGVDHQTEVRKELCDKTYIIADFLVGDLAIEAKVDISQDSMLKAFGQCQAYITSGLAKRSALLLPNGVVPEQGFIRLFRLAGIEIHSEATLVGALLNERRVPAVPTDACETLKMINYYSSELVAGFDLLTTEEIEQSRDKFKELLRPILEFHDEMNAVLAKRKALQLEMSL